MKRFLSMLLTAVIVVSFVAFSACADGEGGTSVSNSTSAAFSSADRPNNDSRVIISEDDSFSSSTPTVSTEASSSQSGAASSTAPVPTPSPTGALEIDVARPASLNIADCVTEADFIMYQIGELGAIYYRSNGDDSSEAIVDAEDSYNAFSDKAQISSAYSDYLAAVRVAYDKAATNDVNNKIATIPAATIDNVNDFAQAVALIESIIPRIKDASNINTQELGSKKNAAMQITVDAFIKAVEAIQSFSFTAEYKQKLDNAELSYANVAESKKLDEAVVAAKLTFDTQLKLYNDTSVANGFTTAFNALPAVEALAEGDKPALLAVRELYNSLTESQKLLIDDFAAIQTKMAALLEKMATISPFEYFWIAEDMQISGQKTFSGNEHFIVSYSGENKTKQEFSYGDGSRTLTVAMKFQSDRYFTIVADSKCTLTVYCVGNGTSFKLTATGQASSSAANKAEGTLVTTVSGTTAYTIQIPAAGRYELWRIKSETLIFALSLT